MKAALAPLLNFARLTWYRWALSEICPSHIDVPRIVLRIRELEEM